MIQPTLLTQKHKLGGFLYPRLMIVIVGLALQLFVLVAVLSGIGQPQTPDISLAPVAGDASICTVVAVRPFSESWVRGIQAGMQVRIVDSAPLSDCKITTQSIELEIVGLPAHSVSVNVLSPPVDFIKIVTNLILALIFSVTGIAIFLRAENRPTARVTYVLFSCTALAFCLFNPRSIDALSFNLLGFLLSMLMRGLSATFVCLFPYSSQQNNSRRSAPILPYLPLLIGIALAIVGLFMPLAAPPVSFAFTIVSFIFSIVCVLIVIGIMIWGLRHLKRQERQFVRMVVLGIIFLLFPLALNLNLDQSRQGDAGEPVAAYSYSTGGFTDCLQLRSLPHATPGYDEPAQSAGHARPFMDFAGQRVRVFCYHVVALHQRPGYPAGNAGLCLCRSASGESGALPVRVEQSTGRGRPRLLQRFLSVQPFLARSERGLDPFAGH